MPIRAFKQIDVFTATPYLGNPLAVVLDGAGLDDEALQRFAHWTNLSETTFVLPPTEAGRAGGADYRVRIFTPGGELPFAGHPTLGTCHAWLEAGGTPRASGAAGGTPRHEEVIVQECGVGLVRIRRRGHRLAFAAPPVQRSTPGPALLAKARFVASVSADGRGLVLKPLDALPIDADRALELWAVPPQGAPRSLGLVAKDASTRVIRVELLKNTAAFAVSVEPSGGSPTGAPTGPIISVGKLES